MVKFSDIPKDYSEVYPTKKDEVPTNLVADNVNERERLEREKKLFDKIFTVLHAKFTVIKGESLTMVEASALREIIRFVISITEDLSKEGLIEYNAQEKFYNYIGIGTIGLDPAPKGMELNDEEVRVLWKKYGKEGKLFIDDEDEQEQINKMYTEGFDELKKQLEVILKSRDVEKITPEFLKKLIYKTSQIDEWRIDFNKKFGVQITEEEYKNAMNKVIDKFTDALVSDLKYSISQGEDEKLLYKYIMYNYINEIMYNIRNEISNCNWREFISRYISEEKFAPGGIIYDLNEDADLIVDGRVPLFQNKNREIESQIMANRNNPLELKNIIQKLVIDILERRHGHVDDKQLIGQEINSMLDMLKDRTLSVNDVIDRTIGAYEERYLYSEK